MLLMVTSRFTGEVSTLALAIGAAFIIVYMGIASWRIIGFDDWYDSAVNTA